MVSDYGTELDSSDDRLAVFNDYLPRFASNMDMLFRFETIYIPPGDIDLLIVPGLGFDNNGNRLGQGKGYYDRWIERMTKDGITLPLIAVGLTPQLVTKEDVDGSDDDSDGSIIPTAEYDRRMDIVLLPNETIIC